MARACAVCGKTVSFGKQITRRGLAKAKGGVGQKVTGGGPRLFVPNLQNVRIKMNGTVRKTRVCARCIKNGRVLKAV